MRVGLVIYGSLDTLSGGYLYDRRLVEYLRGCGDEVEVLSQPWLSYARCLRQNFDTGFRQKLASLDVDVLLQDELNHPSLFRLNRWLKPRVKYPLISIVHHLRSSEQHPRGWKAIYRRVELAYLDSVDGFIFNSQTTQRVVEGLLDRSTPGIIATPGGDQFAGGEAGVAKPGAEFSNAHSHRMGGEPLRILFLGNLIPRKGLHTLLEALAQLLAPGWQLDVVGQFTLDPTYTRRMRALAAPLGERVRFHGRLGDADMHQLWRSAHLLVVPSSYEGFGIVYLEGMSFGLPAIGSTAGAAAEIIQDGVNGFLVPPGEPSALAVRLAQLAGDRELLARMSRAARHRFEQFPTWQQSMTKIRDYLVTFAGGGG